jgi:O-antigen/teichoic acid export membrane protein
MLARKLAPDAYGQFVFIQFVIDLIGLLCSFGIPGVLTRFLPQLSQSGAEGSKPLLRALAGLCLAAMVLGASALVIYRTLDPHFVRANLSILTIWCVLSLALTFVYAGLQGIFRYDSVLAGNLAYAAAAPAAVSLLVGSGSVTNAAGAMTLALGASALVALLTLKLRPGRTPSSSAQASPAMKDVAAYGMNVWVTGLIVGLVWSRGEFAILRSFANDSAIGIYAVAITLTGLVTQGAGLFTGALTPYLVRQWAAGDSAELRNTLIRVTSILLMAGSAAAAVLIGFGTYLIQLVFGPEYADAHQLLYILSIGGVAIVSGPASLLLQIQSNARFGLFTNAAALVLLLLISACLTPSLGTSGAAVGRATSQIMVAGIAFWQLGKLQGLGDPARRLLLAWLAISCALGCLALFVSSASPGLAATTLAVLATLCLALWSTQRMLGTNPFGMLAERLHRRREV